MDKNINIGIDVEVNSSKSLAQLKQEIKDLQKKIDLTPQGTKEYNDLVIKLRQAKGEIKDFKETTKGLDPDQRAAKLVRSFQGMTGAIQASAAAMTLFGAESGNLEKVEKNLLGIIAIGGGVQATIEGINDAVDVLGPTFRNLGQTIQAGFTAGATGAQTFKAALAATGIGLAVVAVGTLVSYFLELASAEDDAAAAAEKFNKTLQGTVRTYQVQRTEIEKSLDVSLAQAELDEKSAEEKSKLRQQAIKDLQTVNKAEVDNLTELKKRRLQEIAESDLNVKEKKQAVKELNDAILSESYKLGDEQIKLEKELKLEVIKLAQERANKLKQIRETEANQLIDANEAARQLIFSRAKTEEEQAKIILDNTKASLEEQKQVEIKTAKEAGTLTVKLKEQIDREYNNKRILAEEEYSKKLIQIQLKNVKEQAKFQFNQLEVEVQQYLSNLEQEIIDWNTFIDAFPKIFSSEDVEKELVSIRKFTQGTAEEYAFFLTNAKEYNSKILEFTGDSKEAIEKEYEFYTKVNNQKISILVDTYNSLIEESNSYYDKLIQAEKDAAAKDKTYAEQANKNIEILLADRTNAVKEYTKQKDNELKKSAQTEVQLETNKQNKLKALREKDLKDVLNGVNQTLQAISNVYNTFVDAELESAQRRLDAQLEFFEQEKNARIKSIEDTYKQTNNIAVTQEEIKAAQIAQVEEEYAAKAMAARKRQWEQEQKIRKTQVIINGITGASQIVASQAANPVLMAISLAALGAITTRQVMTINEQEFPEYAEGGMIEGPGTGTSDSILARVSNGEYIVNAKSTQANLPVLEALNKGEAMPPSPTEMRLNEILERLEVKLDEPSRAYVLQGDVFNSVQAQYQINSKRKL